MTEECFLVEPIYGDPDMPADGRPINRWDGTNRPILGWRAVDNHEEVKDSPEQFGNGSIYEAVWIPKGFVWTNEIEPHLYIQTEEGGWDIDGRALDCTLPNDRTHRCWVRTGVAPKITVGKSGHTCQAGIYGGRNYHGVLVNGRLRT